jgi:hypothetical protein
MTPFCTAITSSQSSSHQQSVMKSPILQTSITTFEFLQSPPLCTATKDFLQTAIFYQFELVTVASVNWDQQISWTPIFDKHVCTHVGNFLLKFKCKQFLFLYYIYYHNIGPWINHADHWSDIISSFIFLNHMKLNKWWWEVNLRRCRHYTFEHQPAVERSRARRSYHAPPPTPTPPILQVTTTE